MLSRRSVRIKVVQVLYALNRDKKSTQREGKLFYQKMVSTTYKMYLFNMLQLMHVAKYARKDKSIRDAKLLPSKDDKNFTSKLCDNVLIESLLENRTFAALIKSKALVSSLNNDLTRKLYNEFSKTDKYKKYLEEESDKEAHSTILLSLYKSIIDNELFDDHVLDLFYSWTQDKSLVLGAAKRSIRDLQNPEFFKKHEPSLSTVTEFGEDLLYKVCFFDKELLDYIEPYLRNWEADRVAVIDMILMKMALAELMYFPSIPVKVTINEYVEISKLYSTPKSKDFINGILDKLMKKLTAEGKIEKSGRGLVE